MFLMPLTKTREKHLKLCFKNYMNTLFHCLGKNGKYSNITPRKQNFCRIRQKSNKPVGLDTFPFLSQFLYFHNIPWQNFHQNWQNRKTRKLCPMQHFYFTPYSTALRKHYHLTFSSHEFWVPECKKQSTWACTPSPIQCSYSAPFTIVRI